MKKKSFIISIFACLLCLTMLAGVTSENKKPIFAKELCFAEEEVIEYTLQEENEEVLNSEENQEVEDNKAFINVIGKAKISLTPDMATITACIEKFNENMTISKNDNLNVFNSVSTALKDSGIDANSISMDYFTSHPSYDFSLGYSPIGFYSKSCFSFEVKNLNDIQTYINILTENGVTNICDICYTVSNIDQQYNNALSQALENAKNKAFNLLNTENLQICGIREEHVFSSTSNCHKYIENDPSTTGKVEIEAQVSVSFKEI